MGLVNGSFIPPKDIRELRQLTRYRTKLVSMRTSEKDRVHNILESCNIKLSCVATDIFGVSGMAIMKALIAEEADPEELAELAKGRLRNKIPDLVKALNGYARVETLSWTNYNEGIELVQHVKAYRSRYGFYPEAISADKIYRNRDSLRFCKKHGIRLSGPPLGRPNEKELQAQRGLA